MKSEFSEVSQMDELIAILKDIHPDVDYETATNLIDGKILDSFDIISLVSEINDKFDVVISAEYMIPENFNSAKATIESYIPVKNSFLMATSKCMVNMIIKDTALEVASFVISAPILAISPGFSE